MPRRLASLSDLSNVISDAPPDRPLTLGQSVCLGLEDLRSALGETAFRKAESFIEKHLAAAVEEVLDPGDSFMRARDGSYLVVFASPNPALAETKSARIADYVNQKLFGDESLSGVTVASVVETEEGLDEGERRAPQEIIGGLMAKAERRAAGGRSGGAGAGGAPADAGAPAEETAEAARGPSRREGLEGRARRIRDAVEMNSLDFRNLMSGDQDVDDAVYIGYTPIWDAEREAVDRFSCVPMKQVAMEGGKLLEYAVLERDASAKEIADLDLSVFAAAVEASRRAGGGGRFAAISCNMHFETLSDRRTRDKILSLMRGAPRGLREAIMMQIVGAPVGVTESRLREIVSPALEACRDVFVRLDPRALRNRLVSEINRLHAVGVTMVVLEMPTRLRAGDGPWLASLKQARFRSGTTFGARNVCTPTMAKRLRGLGVTLMTGPLCGGPFAEMPKPYPLTENELARPINRAMSYSKAGGHRRDRFLAIARMFDVGFLVMAPSTGGGPLEICYASGQTESILGAAAEEVVGRTLPALLSEGDDGAAVQRFEDDLMRRGEASTALRIGAGDGCRVAAVLAPASHNEPKGACYAFVERWRGGRSAPPRRRAGVEAHG